MTLSRRQAIGTTLAAFLGLLLRRESVVGQRYGRVTIDRGLANDWLPGRVWLDGKDVSNDCRELDDQRGYVVLFERDSGGWVVYDGDQIKTQIQFGHVVFCPKGVL